MATGSGPIPFTVDDADTPAASMRVRTANDNFRLLGAGSIVLGGSGAKRTLTLTPVKLGTVNFTVEVDDGVANSSSRFVLEVVR
jgi:hypothetical protein